MKLARIINPNFLKALNAVAAEPLPIKAAYKLKKIIRKTQEEYNRFEDVRNAGIMKYSEKNEDGTVKVSETSQAIMSEENMTKFTAELDELIMVDIDLMTLTVSELGDIKITIADLEWLEGVVVD